MHILLVKIIIELCSSLLPQLVWQKTFTISAYHPNISILYKCRGRVADTNKWIKSLLYKHMKEDKTLHQTLSPISWYRKALNATILSPNHPLYTAREHTSANALSPALAVLLAGGTRFWQHRSPEFGRLILADVWAGGGRSIFGNRRVYSL